MSLPQVDAFVREQIEAHPLRLLGAAFLVGFVMGGGLSSRIARFALLAGARYASRAIWRDLAAVAAGGATRSLSPSLPPHAPSLGSPSAPPQG